MTDSQQRPARAAALRSLALALALCATIGLVSAGPASAIRRPHGPSLQAPKPAATVRTSSVAFRWRPVRGITRYDLRIARNRAFTLGVTTLRARRPGGTALLPGGTWYWRVRSRGRIASRWSNTRMVSVRPTRDVFAPTRPGALSVAEVGSTTVALRFVAARDNVGVASYRVTANDAPVATTTSTTPLVDGLACATTYTFAVVALDAAGNASPPSPVAHARTHACSDTLAPTVPANVAAVSVSDSSAALTWDAASDPDGSLAGYAVYRNGVLLGQPTSAGYVAHNLAAATAYTFTVRARDHAGHASADSPPLAVTTLAPAPATGPAYAFLLATVDASFQDLQRHYRQIATIAPTYYEVHRDGSIGGNDDPLVTHWARVHGVKVEPRFHTEDPTTLHALLSDPTARDALAARIAAVAAAGGYDGANVDFEAGPATDRAALTTFAATLAGLLHAQGQTLTLALSPKSTPTTTGRSGFYDYPALAQAADHLFVMAWDLHWATSPAGPISDASWVAGITSYVATMPNAARFVIGTQLYGFDWPAGGRATPWEYDGVQSLLASVGATPAWNPVAQEPYFTYTDASGVAHTVYYANAQSIEPKFALARARGLGVGLWRLGTEDQTVWNNPSLQP